MRLFDCYNCIKIHRFKYLTIDHYTLLLNTILYREYIYDKRLREWLSIIIKGGVIFCLKTYSRDINTNNRNEIDT